MNPQGKNKKIQKKKQQNSPPLPLIEKQAVPKWIWIALGVVLLTTLAIYFRTLSYDLLTHWDDKSYVTDNEHIRGLKWENIKLFFTEYYAGNYQPVTILMYALEYKFAGADGSLYHLNNLLLHLLNTLLVFVFVRKISPQNAYAALITAAFFAVHPMHVESVAWVSERKDVLYTFFFLISLIIYSDYLRTQKNKHLILSSVFYVLSCLSKPAAVILPLVLLLIDYYAGRKFSKKIILEKLHFFLIAFVIGLVTVKAQGEALHNTSSVPFIQHFSMVTFAFITYIAKAFVPVNLSAIYPYPVDYGGNLSPLYYLTIAVAGLILYFVWHSRKWGKEIIFGFLFFLITIILVLQLKRVGGVTLSERYTYVPYIGIFFILGRLFENHADTAKGKLKKYKNYLLAFLVVCFALFSILTYLRVQIWENDRLLFSDVIKKYPDCGTPHYLLGDHYLDRAAVVADSANKDSNLKQSAANYQDALKCPMNKADKAMVHFNKGCAEFMMKNFQAAYEDFDAAVKLNPKNSLAYGNRGTARYQLGDLQGALQDYNKAIELNPQYTDAINNRENVKQMLGIKN
ncbi:MAG TPA: tetratricopeptide repeat protein [Bacteroidales bacterium]|nr:tetratricopeptide repeat protein [Bacteroidales bacterium]